MVDKSSKNKGGGEGEGGGNALNFLRHRAKKHRKALDAV
jgi:hypothetical protein